MKELRPLGSEKLTGDAKIQRILEIANYGRTPKSSVTVDKPEYITESKNGGVYGIVKEKDGFYVKKGLNESSLEYIGGMFMKNKNRYTSYGEAFKRLDYLKGQESLQEATKYILKQTKTPEVKPMEAAPAEPAMSELPPMDASAPEGEIPPSGDVPPTGAEGEPSPEGGEQLRSSYMANIQKFAGKLGQELRDQKDKLESDDLKYTLNMVISAIDLDQLDDDDFEEIADKFDPEKRNGAEESDLPPLENEPVSQEVPEPEQEMAEENDSIYSGYDEEEEIDEIMSSLEEFINSPVDEEEDSTNAMMRQYSDLGQDEEINLDEDDEIDEYFYSGEDDDHDEVKHDMNSIKNYMDKMDQDKNVDWEKKLRNKSSQKPPLDIDEISRAITQALSKYR